MRRAAESTLAPAATTWHVNCTPYIATGNRCEHVAAVLKAPAASATADEGHKAQAAAVWHQRNAEPTQ